VAIEMAVAALLVLLSPPSGAQGSASLVDVKVTHKDLVPLCLDGASIQPNERQWRLQPHPHVLAFTMHGADAGGKPGVATVRFSPEAGHRYEVEVRAATSAFTSRDWQREKWKPVVRDRTVDQIISSEPEWSDSACQP
jgi:hypothetical protein